MNNIVKLKTTQLYNQGKVKKYEITYEGLLRFISVKPRSQELFLDLLNCITHHSNIDAVIIKRTYKELGFNSFGNFSKYRKELIDVQLIYFEENSYYVNPLYVNYYTRRQQAYFFGLFKIKKNIKVKMNKPKLVRVS